MTLTPELEIFHVVFLQKVEKLTPYRSIIIKLNKNTNKNISNIMNLKSTIYCGTVSQNGDKFWFLKMGTFSLILKKNILFAIGNMAQNWSSNFKM